MKHSFALLVLVSVVLTVTTPFALGNDSESPPTIYRENPAQLGCSPMDLDPNDILTLTLGPNHGSELAITRDSNQWPYFLVVREPPREMTPLMTPEQFKAATRVEIPMTLRAFPWVKDGQMERVFTVAGNYTVHVSDILESEVGGYQCTVRFKGEPHAN